MVCWKFQGRKEDGSGSEPQQIKGMRLHLTTCYNPPSATKLAKVHCSHLGRVVAVFSPLGKHRYLEEGVKENRQPDNMSL